MLIVTLDETKRSLRRLKYTFWQENEHPLAGEKVSNERLFFRELSDHVSALLRFYDK